VKSQKARERRGIAKKRKTFSNVEAIRKASPALKEKRRKMVGKR